MRLLTTAALTLALIAAVPVALASSCNDPNEISCRVCPSSSRGNDIAGLPRLNARGHLISNDLGHYQWYECDAFGNNCQSFLDNLQYTHWANRMPNDSNPINYIQSIAAYVIFGVGCLVITLVIGFSLCCCRYWYDRDIGGLCGGRFPQRKLRMLGVVIDPEKKEWKYPRWERWLARFLMVAFVALVWTWIGLGYFQGTARLPMALKETIKSPSAIVDTIQGTQLPIATLLMNIAEHTLIDAVNNITVAFNTTVSLPTIMSSLTCVNTTVQSLPTSQSINTMITSMLDNTAVTGLIGVMTTASLTAQSLISTDLHPIVYSVGNVSGASRVYQSDASALAANLTVTSTHVANTSALVTSLNGNCTGPIVNGLNAYMNHYPNTSIISNTTVSNYASLSRLANGSVTMPAAERSLLVARLRSINDSMALLPNLTTLSAMMTQYNSRVNTITAATGPINRVILALNISQSLLTLSLPNSLSTINTSLSQLVASIGTVSFADVVAYIGTLNGTFNGYLATHTAFNTTAINATVNSLLSFSTLLPCMNALIPEVNNTINNLITLPLDIDSLVSYTVIINQSLPLTMAVLTNLTDTIAELSAELTQYNFDFSGLVSVINDNQLALQSLSSVVNNSFVETLAGIQTGTLTSAINYDSVLTTLDTLNSTLKLSLLSGGSITAFQSSSIVVNSAYALLTRMIGDLALWSSSGAKRCKTFSGTVCSTDSQCLATDYCLTDTGRVHSLSTLLGNVSVVYINNTSAIAVPLMAVNAIDTNVVSAMATSLSVASTIGTSLKTSANTSVNYLVSQTSALTTVDSQLDTVFATLIADFSATINSNVINVTAIQSSLLSLSSVSTLVQTSLNEFSDVFSLIEIVYNFLFVEFPTVYAPMLMVNNNAYQTTPQARLSNLTLGLAQVINNMTAYLDRSPELAVFDSFDLVNTTAKLRNYMDMLYTNDNAQHGAIYYLMKVYNQFSSQFNLLEPNNAINSGTYDQDSAGNKYVSNTYCFSDNCLDHTVDYFADNSLKTVTSDRVPLPVTMTHLNGLLYIVPGFIALLGLIAMLLYFNYKASSWMASISACLLFIFLPLIFLFAAVLFPMVVVQGDVCYGGVNLTYNMLLSKADNVCEMIGGTGTANNCDFPINDFDIILDLPALFSDVIGGRCSSEDGEADNAVLAMFNSVRYSAATYPKRQILNYIDSINTNTSSINIQQQLYGIFAMAADNSVQYINQFVDNFSAELTCEELNADWESMHSAFCCSVTTSMYWLIGSWFLIGLSMMCCGVPATVLGRKRFATVIPKEELKIIDEHFTKERVLKEECYVRRTRISQDHGGNGIKPSGRRSNGGVAPVSAAIYDEIAAIEMACSKADAEKREQKEAEDTIRIVEAHEHKNNQSQIDVVVPSPEVSQAVINEEPEGVPSSRTLSGIDPNNGLGITASSFYPPHASGMHRSLTSTTPRSPHASPVNDGEPDHADSGSLPQTPMTILSYGHGVPAIQSGMTVFQYGDSEDHSENSDSDYTNKYPSINPNDDDDEKHAHHSIQSSVYNVARVFDEDQSAALQPSAPTFSLVMSSPNGNQRTLATPVMARASATAIINPVAGSPYSSRPQQFGASSAPSTPQPFHTTGSQSMANNSGGLARTSSLSSQPRSVPSPPPIVDRQGELSIDDASTSEEDNSDDDDEAGNLNVIKLQ